MKALDCFEEIDICLLMYLKHVYLHNQLRKREKKKIEITAEVAPVPATSS